MTTLIVTVTLPVFAWFVGNTLGWLSIRGNLRESRPFNYRIYLGPWSYSAWLEKWEEDEDNAGL